MAETSSRSALAGGDHRPGRLPTSIAGVKALVVNDPERTISLRGGALRMAPIAEPGWDRSVALIDVGCLEPGQVVWTDVRPAHLSSETLPLETRRDRLQVWLLGSRTDSPARRLALLLSPCRHREGPIRRWRRWLKRNEAMHRRAPASVNQIVGLFADTTGTTPADALAGLAVRPLGPRNGGFSIATPGGEPTRHVIDGCTNTSYRMAFIVRPDSILIAVGGEPGTALAPAPALSPLGIVHRSVADTPLWLGVSNLIVGQHGFSSDTIIEGLGVDRLGASAPGCGVPQATANEHRTHQRLEAEAIGGVALIDVRLELEQEGSLELRWGSDSIVSLTRSLARLQCDGETISRPLAAHGPVHLSVNVLGGRTRVHVDDQLLLDLPSSGTHQSTSSGTHQSNSAALTEVVQINLMSGRVDRFEVLPFAVGPVGGPSTSPLLDQGNDVVADQRFDGAALVDLAEDEDHDWQRVLGNTPIGREYGVASIVEPLTERTVYLQPNRWSDSVDIETEIEPPPRVEGVLQRCRAGLAAGSGPDNLLMVNAWIDDSYGGGSVSTFLRLDGGEEIFDAVWVNVGAALDWTTPFVLRLQTDGDFYRVMLDGHTVVSRSISDQTRLVPRIEMTHVGIVANWEWGLDTGSLFRRFTVRGPSTSV